MVKMKKVSVIIGRFQPFHVGHLEMVQSAYDISDEVVLFIGSANKPTSDKNPWTHRERLLMIYDSIQESKMNIGRFHFFPAMDCEKNSDWVKQIKLLTELAVSKKSHIQLVGHNRDDSSFYLSLFPFWNFHEVGEFKDNISATEVRKLFFENQDFSKFVPNGTKKIIENTKQFVLERL